MCLTTEMLAAFLKLISPEIVTTEPARVTVHAEVGDTVWEAKDDLWCAEAPDALLAAAE